MFTTVDRAAACLMGVATAMLSASRQRCCRHEDVHRWYPRGNSWFRGPSSGTVIPRYAGNRKREWRIGETTDDTERTIAVARAILAEGRVSHVGVGREMLGCTKSVHPGVRSLWEFHQAADPARIATGHEGCGAAIRVAAVGIAYSWHDLQELVTAAREASISTHSGSLAVAAAAATAAAVSAAIDEASPQLVLEVAARAATLAERQWPGNSLPVFADAILSVRERLYELPALSPTEVATCCFPNQPLTIVPLALALATTMRSAEDAILLAANIGGDSDSVASHRGRNSRSNVPRHGERALGSRRGGH